MKKWLSVMMILVLAVVPVFAQAQSLAKDETVYTMLDATGKVQGATYVVSHLDTPEAGEYTDYGTYTRIEAMLTEAQLAVGDDGTITWMLPESAEGFYAVGEMEEAQLPFMFDISYTLDGESIAPEALAGATGSIEGTIAIKANPDAEEAFRTRYMAQIQVPINLAVASGVQAPAATTSIVGQTQTLAFTVLPGQDAVFTFTLDAQDFTMDGMTIACMPMDLTSMLDEDTQVLLSQVGEMQEGVAALAEGAAQLSGGVTTLAENMQTLSDNVGAMPEQVGQLETGTQQLAEGVSAYVEGTTAALGGITPMATALGDVAGSGDALVEGTGALLEALAPVIAKLPQEQQMAMQTELQGLVDGLTQYTQGVTAIAGQATTLSQAAGQLTGAGQTLVEGMTQQAAGVTALKTGVDQLAEGTAALPEAAAQLQEGASALAEGLGSMQEGMDSASGALDGLTQADGDAEIPSFAAQGHTVRSVQFVYMTEAIAKPVVETVVEKEAAPETFWDRLMGIF